MVNTASNIMIRCAVLCLLQDMPALFSARCPTHALRHAMHTHTMWQLDVLHVRVTRSSGMRQHAYVAPQLYMFAVKGS